MNTQKVITVLAVGQKHGKSVLERRLTPKLLIQRLPLTLLGPQPLALLIRRLPPTLLGPQPLALLRRRLPLALLLMLMARRCQWRSACQRKPRCTSKDIVLQLKVPQLEGVCEEGVDPIMASHCC
jgi:hypothetical protein